MKNNLLFCLQSIFIINLLFINVTLSELKFIPSNMRTTELKTSCVATQRKIVENERSVIRKNSEKDNIK